MKLKFLFSTVALMMIAPALHAQITTGEPTAKVIKTGNRAQKGDMGLYVGATTSMFKDIINDDIDVNALPLLNFKYMNTKDLEYRIGLKIYSSKEKLKGELFNVRQNNDVTEKVANSQYFITPGFAHHFSNSNLLDVYGGLELPVGLVYDRRFNESGGVESSMSRAQFQIGLGAFVGFQAYIANLPIAVGVEYGISSMLKAGNKWKIDDGEDTYYCESSSYYPNYPYTSTKYKTLSQSDSSVGNEIRVTLSYFFK